MRSDLFFCYTLLHCYCSYTSPAIFQYGAFSFLEVVGYQQQDLTGKQYNAVGATFAGVSASGKVRLGDIVAKGFAWDSEMLQAINTSDASTSQSYSYITAESATDEWEDSTMQGWWVKNKEGEDDSYRADDVEVDIGTGFLGNFGKKSVEFTYSGAVVDGSSEIDLTDKQYNMIANFLPINIKLGDVVANGFAWDSEMIQEISTSDASTAHSYSYITAESATDEWEDSTMQGWWVKNKEGEDDAYRADAVTWESGKAFLSNFGKKSVKMVFPDPLTYSAE